MLQDWVETSPHGHGLYKKYGFEDVEDVRVLTKSFVGEYTHEETGQSPRILGERTGQIVNDGKLKSVWCY